MNDQQQHATTNEWDGKRSSRRQPAEDATQPKRVGRYRIDKPLGEGGFGRVYLADDEQLNRRVAVKVPHQELLGDKTDVQVYLDEARTVASLDHPHIVPVYDVGSTDEVACFIVSKFVEGRSLAELISQSRVSYERAAELVATIADALHYAHRRLLVHRDVKPGNILLDRDGVPFLVDFGMALREQDVGKGPKFAGTPAYMSPEQARGEGHRVDGRSDILSLGVVFYELLVGRRPFYAKDGGELLEQVATSEPRPPRQYDDAIPKGLRSFDAHDADFFVELLPGVRDRHGLPDSLRFWKTRIGEREGDDTFAVGLIYGPSGCGKSSFVKAGLLPRLAEHVIPIYVEANSNDTETRLLKAIHRHCPALASDLPLVESLAALRRGQGVVARYRKRHQRTSLVVRRVAALSEAAISRVPKIVRDMERYQPRGAVILRERLDSAEDGSPERLRFSRDARRGRLSQPNWLPPTHGTEEGVRLSRGFDDRVFLRSRCLVTGSRRLVHA